VIASFLEVNERETGAVRAYLSFEWLRGKLFSKPVINALITFRDTEED
jgi:hypothetical protein